MSTDFRTLRERLEARQDALISAALASDARIDGAPIDEIALGANLFDGSMSIIYSQDDQQKRDDARRWMVQHVPNGRQILDLQERIQRSC